MNDDAMKKKQFAEEIDRDLAEGRVLELAEVYALNAVSEEERANIEVYVSAAPDPLRRSFEERVRQARETLTATYALEEVEPPADLLSKIMARLPEQATRDQPQHGPVQADPDPAEALDARPTAADELSVRREQKARRRDLSTGRRWLVGVAAAALIAIGGVAVGSSIISAQDPVHQILNASDVQTRKLPIPGGGTATLAISGSKDAAVVTMQAVPAPPTGQVYQMWLIPKDGAAPVSQGTMDAEALTRSATIKGVDAAAAFAITVEPAGGSPTPTLPTVASLTLSS